MQRAVTAVAERINAGGGIHGRPIQLFHEDSQTNAEAAVRAARKLIDVNKVVAILSTWASAVTLAVKPLCVEAKVFEISVSGADAVTEGNHGGYIARTQPNTRLQGRMYAKYVLTRKEWKRVAYMALQTPFAVPFGETFTGTLKPAGVRHHRQPDLRGQQAIVPERGDARARHQSRPHHGGRVHARQLRPRQGPVQGGLQGRDPRTELRHQRQVHRERHPRGRRGHLVHGPRALVRLPRLQAVCGRRAPRGSEPVCAPVVGPPEPGRPWPSWPARGRSRER